MKVKVQTASLTVDGKQGITTEPALGFAKVFGMTPQFWMSLQANLDLWHADRGLGSDSHA